MKKNSTTKLAWMGVTLCACLLVACGLKITKVTLSSNAIEKNGEVTVTTQFERADGDFDNNSNIYLLYAIRVPSDWTYTEALEAISTHNGVTDTFEFEESKPYATLAEFCYPKSGYKWIGFQTKQQVTLTCDNNGQDNVITTLTLKGGEKSGNYKLDIISGSFPRDPSILLAANGSVDVNVAFGRKTDFEAADPKTLSDGTQVFGFSEYLVNASTISPAEKLAAEKTLLSYTADVNGVTYPISGGVDIGNGLTDQEIAALELNVIVGDPTSVSTIEVAEDDNAPVYNLQGMKVADTSVPGIYIRNGKKFIVK